MSSRTDKTVRQLAVLLAEEYFQVSQKIYRDNNDCGPDERSRVSEADYVCSQIESNFEAITEGVAVDLLNAVDKQYKKLCTAAYNNR